MSKHFNRYVAVYRASQGDFEERVEALLAQVDASETPLRLTFFGNPASNAIYEERWALLRQCVARRWKNRMPALSYVAQPALDAPLVMELYGYHPADGDQLLYGQAADTSYVLLCNAMGRFLFAGGFRGDSTSLPIEQQAEQAFQRLEVVLRQTGFSLTYIQRQWNYIERITAFDGIDQHYQAFNNVRSAHYAKAEWPAGYPAATGIGSHFGGVLIDVDVAQFTDPEARALPIDNRLQVAAHAYSEGVLEQAQRQKSTPKFERAKALICGGARLIYISGTAAIRGEESLASVGLARQLQVTMENIAELTGSASLAYLRVYLKNPADYVEASRLLEAYGLGIPITFMWADVCRNELLIEIEGLASEENG